jgi:CO/xanthine dehydrogenase FAD-binding subunit
MAMPRFEYLSPKSIQEACALLAEHQGMARVMAGGTDLIVKMKHRLFFPRYVVGLKNIPDLNVILYQEEKGLTIGATALLSQVAEHPVIREKYPALAQAAQSTATVAIRNMGTVVGNLCNAAPSADNAPALLALNASIRVVGPNNERTFPLEQFFRGPGLTALDPEEIVREIQVPPPRNDSAACFKHLSARSRVDISAVNVGVWVTVKDFSIQDCRIFLGAVAPIPMRAVQTEEMIRGKKGSEDLFREAGIKASQECSPITDVRASAEYRRKLVAVLTHRALTEACETANQPLECRR